MKIPLIKPYINEEIKKNVLQVLDSGYLTEGPITKEFEKEIKSYIGCEYALAVTSATTGLETALRCLNIGRGDEVIVPDYTYPATATVVSLVGATPVIVDVSKQTMLIDCQAIEEAITPNTKAIIPVSGFGNPLNYDELNKLKNKYELFIIEDAACSLGAEYNGVKVGNQADISVFSLHPRKFITTGEGGIITTNNSEWALWMDSYKHFGMNMKDTSRKGIQFDIIGTNYKLSNILAAVGLGQLKEIDTLLSKRLDLASNYKKLLEGVKGVVIPETIENGVHSYQSFCVFINDRDRIMSELRGKGVEAQIGTYALHMHEAFNNNPEVLIKGDMTDSKWCFDHTLTLPLYNELSYEQQEFIVKELKSLL